MSSQQQLFEALLKKSDYLRDLQETQRRATTNVISAIAQAIIEQQPAVRNAIIEKLRDAEVMTGSESIDCESRKITRVIIEDILQPRTPNVPRAPSAQRSAPPPAASRSRSKRGQGSAGEGQN